MKANFDAGPLSTSYRFEITVGLIILWMLTGLAAFLEWFPVWVPLLGGPAIVINLLARHLKGDL
jgi:hypothetical protein